MSIIPIEIKEVCRIVGGMAAGGNLEAKVTGVKIDTRNINSGDLFVAIPGERTDGHLYLKAAKEAGAIAALCEKTVEPVQGLSIIQVENTVKALQMLAKSYRERFQIPIVALTGSSGKTTTKNILVGILSQKYVTVGTLGNKNNHIGMPLMALEMDENTQAAVFEMGMSGFGEIETLVKIAKPDLAIITNIGTAHLEQLKSRENILKAKSEIFTTLGPSQTALVNGDDPYLATLTSGPYKIYRFGIEEKDLDLTCSHYEMTMKGLVMTVREKGKETEESYSFSLPGKHNVYNCLAGIAAAKLLGLTKEQIQMGLDSFTPAENRMEIVSLGTCSIINDTYNANPQSMKSALDVLALYKEKAQTVAILGDMLEMGIESPEYHMEIGAYAASLGVDYLFAFGESAKHYIVGALPGFTHKNRVRHFVDQEELVRALLPLLKQDTVFLVKGSRGMKMEKIVKAMKEIEG